MLCDHDRRANTMSRGEWQPPVLAADECRQAARADRHESRRSAAAFWRTQKVCILYAVLSVYVCTYARMYVCNVV